MRVYIDCGAYTGDTVDCEKLFGFKADKKIAFEANQKLIKQVEAAGYDKVYNKAVWVNDDRITFWQDQSKEPLGSTVKKSKTTGVLTPVFVDAVDFSEWLKDYLMDEVLIKLDIEGAEFDILEKMIKDKTILIANKIYVEFHPNKVPEYTTTDKLELIAKIKALGVDIEEWH